MRGKLAAASARPRSRTIPELLQLRARAGKAAFGDNCAPATARARGGAKAIPNLNDDDWLWGGSLEDIQQTIRHGVRSGPRRERAHGEMPAFGRTAS